MFNYTKSQIIVVPIMYALMFIIAFILWYFLKDKKLKIKRIPIQIISLTLLILEVAKQIFLIATKEWTTWALPFHFCSSFYIWFTISSFAKKEETQQIGYLTSITSSLVLWILFLTNPSGVIGDAIDLLFKDFIYFHTFVFHFLTMLMWLVILSLKIYKTPSNKTILISTFSFLGFYVLATIMAYSLNVNFICILENGIPFIEKFRINYGQFLYNSVMYSIGVALPLIVSYGSKLIFKVIKSRKPIELKKSHSKA